MFSTHIFLLQVFSLKQDLFYQLYSEKMDNYSVLCTVSLLHTKTIRLPCNHLRLKQRRTNKNLFEMKKKTFSDNL